MLWFPRSLLQWLGERLPLHCLFLHACLLWQALWDSPMHRWSVQFPQAQNNISVLVVRTLSCTIFYLIIFKFWICYRGSNENYLHKRIESTGWIKGANIWVETKSYVKVTYTGFFLFVIDIIFPWPLITWGNAWGVPVYKTKKINMRAFSFSS